MKIIEGKYFTLHSVRGLCKTACTEHSWRKISDTEKNSSSVYVTYKRIFSGVAVYILPITVFPNVKQR